MRFTLAALAAAALLAGQAASAATSAGPRATAPGAVAKAKSQARATHPDIGAAAGDCASCHASATPESYAAWRDSKHGLALVKCLACHGSTGKDFARRPKPARCIGCHGEQVASLGASSTTKGKDCFSCHAAHALSPHVARKDQTAAARIGADAALEREREAGPVNGPAAPPPPAATPPAPTPTSPPTASPTPTSTPTAASTPPPTPKPQGSTP